MRSKIDIKNAKILVTGGTGFLGKFVTRELLKRGADPKKIIIHPGKKSDLRKRVNCIKATKNIDAVIHLAGIVGGIGMNQEIPGSIFYDNAIMGIELIEAARVNNVKKFVCIGTVCAYPKFTPTPFKEGSLWDGYPEETNAPYGLAKKMLLVQSQAYRKQYGMNCIYLLPVNLYGPGDNFDPKSSHVIPALIRKINDAKNSGKKMVNVWGDGTPTREFLYVEDGARAIVAALLKYDKGEPVNLGAGREISIRDLALKISKVLNFKGKIKFETKKPNGQPRRLLDTTRAKKEFGFTAYVSFDEGLLQTISWYISTERKPQKHKKEEL